MNIEALLNLDLRSPEIPHIVCADSWDVLEAIHDPEVNLALLKRPAPDYAQVLAEIQSNTAFSHVQMVFEAGDDLDLIAAEVDHALNLASPDAIRFLRDVAELALVFQRLSRAQRIGLRLENVRSEQCRRFHVDQVSLRLVTTYVGPGSEWVAEKHVDRGALSCHEAQWPGDPNPNALRFQTGWVGVMKGERYPGNGGRGFVHRSPSVADLQVRPRLLLRMDALESYDQ